MSCYKKKLQRVGHKWVIYMWITSGLFCGSVDQMAQTGATHFQPCYIVILIKFMTCMRHCKT